MVFKMKTVKLNFDLWLTHDNLIEYLIKFKVFKTEKIEYKSVKINSNRKYTNIYSIQAVYNIKIEEENDLHEVIKITKFLLNNFKYNEENLYFIFTIGNIEINMIPQNRNIVENCLTDIDNINLFLTEFNK